MDRNKNIHRFGAFLHTNTLPRLEGLAKATGIGKGGLLEYILLGMSDKDLLAAIERGRVVRAGYSDGRRERMSMAARLRRLPNEKLEALLAAAEEETEQATK